MMVFSYGSNLNKEQWAQRCPSAALVGVGELRGYRLTFTGRSGSWGAAVATVKPAAGQVVPGAVYELRDPEDVRRLDACEGFPSVYDCQKVVVHLASGRALEVWCYVKREQHEGQPSSEYLKTIAVGLREHGLGVAHLVAALGALPAGTPLPPPAPKGKGKGKGKGKPQPKAQPKPQGGGARKGGKAARKRARRARVMGTCQHYSGCDEALTGPCHYCGKPAHCAHHCPLASGVWRGKGCRGKARAS